MSKMSWEMLTLQPNFSESKRPTPEKQPQTLQAAQCSHDGNIPLASAKPRLAHQTRVLGCSTAPESSICVLCDVRLACSCSPMKTYSRKHHAAQFLCWYKCQWKFGALQQIVDDSYTPRASALIDPLCDFMWASCCCSSTLLYFPTIPFTVECGIYSRMKFAKLTYCKDGILSTVARFNSLSSSEHFFYHKRL